MNFTLIPFFIAANLTVDQTDQWIHGPEFIFQTNMAYELTTEWPQQKDPLFAMNLTTVMKCWPKALDGLICRFQDNEMGVESPFLIRFNERGIQSLSLTERLDIGVLNGIRNIVKELSIGVDLKKNLAPIFMAKEDHVLGNCTTVFSVLKFDKEVGSLEDSKRNYDLKVLPLSENENDSVIVIEKKTDQKTCTNTEYLFYRPHDVTVKIANAVNKKRISNDAFRSQSEMQIKTMNISSKNYVTHVVTSIELLGIEPTKEELSPVSFDVVAELTLATYP